MAKRKKKKNREAARRYNVYVIRLDDAVLKHKKFREANPDHVEGKPCVYVGMTAVSPRERFEQHKRGYKANRYVRKYGKFLRRKLFEGYNPMTYHEAQRREVKLANDLRRKRGYAVWQN